MADVAAGKAATADLKLIKTKDLASQLTNAEWMMSMPGTEAQKATLLNCNGCHTLAADHALDAQCRRMGAGHSAHDALHVPEPADQADAAHGSTLRAARPSSTASWRPISRRINLSKTEDWDYKLQTLPRPTGRATHVIITEYDAAAARRSSRMTSSSISRASPGTPISAS